MDLKAIGIYDNATEEEHNQDISLRTNTNVHADDARTRSELLSIRTSNIANTSFGSGRSEPVNRDALYDEGKSVNVRVSENSNIRDRARIRMI